MEKTEEENKEKEKPTEAIKQMDKEPKKQTSDETKFLRGKLEKAEKLAEERLNQLKYLQADIDNLRKRYEKEKEQIIKTASESLIRELLAVLDAFDSALKTTEENKKDMMVLKNKFLDILVNHGLKEIESMGKQFNPQFHEALSSEFDKKQANEIIEVIQKGYLLNSKVIRTSKVKVSKGLKKPNRSEDGDIEEK